MSGGICAFCVFTNGSTAKGCAITLFSDQITFNFMIPRQSIYDIALVECFKVSQSGPYHVLVSEKLMDGSEGSNTLELSDITIALASASDNAAKQENGKLYYFQTSVIGGDVLFRDTNNNWTFCCPWSNTAGNDYSRSTCLYHLPEEKINHKEKEQ